MKLIKSTVVGLSLVAGSVLTADAQVDRGEPGQKERAEGQWNQSSLSMVQVIDGDRYELQLRNGEVVRASVNGLELDPGLVVLNEDEGVYEIHAESGEVLASFRVMRWGRDAGNRWAFAGEGEPMLRARELLEPGIQPWEVVGERAPKTMIGIQHAEVDDQLRAFLGLGEDEARVVLSVIDGKPASKAGIRPFDIIVSIDGQRPVTVERLTEVLDAKEPGDVVDITVLRKGEEKTFGVEVMAFEPTVREGLALRLDRDDLDEQDMQALVERMHREAERLARRGDRFELLLPRMFEEFEQDDRFRLFVNPEQIEEMEEGAEAMAEALELRFEELFEGLDERFGEVEDRFEDFDGFVDERDEQIDERFERFEQEVEERFEELDARFDDLEARLEEMLERFDEQAERRRSRDR